jgi:hypothetical protein
MRKGMAMAENQEVAAPKAEPIITAGNIWDNPIELLVVVIARVCHEANRAYCAALGDLSKPSWAEAPQWQRDSAASGVRFHLDNPTADGRQGHDKWMLDKLVGGWRHGPVRDDANKVHPSLLPYDSLPASERLKDDIFIAIVRGVAEARSADRRRSGMAV